MSLDLTPTSQHLEPPAIPGWFKPDRSYLLSGKPRARKDDTSPAVVIVTSTWTGISLTRQPFELKCASTSMMPLQSPCSPRRVASPAKMHASWMAPVAPSRRTPGDAARNEFQLFGETSSSRPLAPTGVSKYTASPSTPKIATCRPAKSPPT